MRSIAVVKWITLLVGLGLTAYLLYSGLVLGEWLTSGIAGPIVLLFAAPKIFSLDRSTGANLGRGRFRDAPIGVGTVVSTSPTGVMVNQQPQVQIMLDVDTPDGQSFRGMAKLVLAVTDLAAVQPGAVLPVRYVPGSADGRVALALNAPLPEIQAAMTRVQLAKGQITPQQLHIAEHGADAQAVVMAMQPTGEVRGDRPVVQLSLRVTRADGGTFDVVQDRPVLQSVLPRIQPGMVVGVRYLPQDPSEVVLRVSLAS